MPELTRVKSQICVRRYQTVLAFTALKRCYHPPMYIQVIDTFEGKSPAVECWQGEALLGHCWLDADGTVVFEGREGSPYPDDKYRAQMTEIANRLLLKAASSAR